MAGVRRRLRDVGARVSGVLGALRDEVVPEVLGGRPEQDRATDETAGDAAGETADDGASEAADDVAHETTDDVADGTADDELLADAGTPEAAGAPDPGGPASRPAPSGPRARGPVGHTGDVTAPAATDHDPVPALVPDEACAAAVDLARAAAVEEAGPVVGDHLGVEPEDALTVAHSFATRDPAYVGWRWAVTVARADGSDAVTVDEVVLLPGSGALLPPAWVPYSDRVEPGDLGTGDLLPPATDDVRLVPAYADPEADLADEVFWELGLGRPRVLSLDGRADAAERWDDGDTGPRSPRALAAPGQCSGCGFLVLLAGSLRQGFGVCANAQSPDDGRVVALGHGCGAHSETPAELTRAPSVDLVVDDVEFEFEQRGQVAAQAAGENADGGQPGSVDGGEPGPAPGEGGQPGSADGGDPGAAAPVDPLPEPADEEQAEELGHS